MKKRRQTIEPMSNFNLTSLLDVVFILLIAFMIVAPSLKHGIELQLPEVDAEPLPPQEESYTVVIQSARDADLGERFYLGNERVTLSELRDKLIALQRGGKKVNLSVEADKRVPSGVFIEVIATIQQTGIEDVGIPTLPYDEK